MKSNSITGLSFALFPQDTNKQDTQDEIDKAITNGSGDDIVIDKNNFYLFEGDMPSSDVLKEYTDINAFTAAYASKQVLKIENFNIRWTYDKKLRRRKLEKWPVDAESYSSAVDGVAKWACIELNAMSITVGEKLLMFTDAVGSWDDVDQSILVSDTNIVAGEAITVKSINITIQDVLASELA